MSPKYINCSKNSFFGQKKYTKDCDLSVKFSELTGDQSEDCPGAKFVHQFEGSLLVK